TSSNTSLIPDPSVSYTSPNSSGSLSYTPLANQSGSATITVTVHDAGLDWIAGNGDDNICSRSFTVTVTPINDAPVLSGANNFTTITCYQTTNSGDLISSLISGNVTDVDSGAVNGVAV